MKNNNNLLTGRFSPSRLKALDCPWKYDLQYNQKIYPEIPWQSDAATLGSLFHLTAEKWDEFIKPVRTKENFDKLYKHCSLTYKITEDQEPKYLAMVDNFDQIILPILLNPYLDDEVVSTKFEFKMEGDINLRGGENEHGESFFYSFPINISVDRLMELKSGKVIIVDYKTGSSPSISNHLFQMLFYAYCYSQKFRKAFNKIEVWIVFPDDPHKKFIYKLTGDEIFNHMGDFEEEMIKDFQLISSGPFSEAQANVGYPCKFCTFNATELCLPSQMMNGASLPDNKNKKFKTGWPPNEVRVDPTKVLRR